jgi:hypothetical protein
MELAPERIQQIWDYELISGWNESGSIKMWKVVHRFMCKVKGDHNIGDVSFEDTEDYLVSLNLKRCLDIDHQYDCHIFRAYNTDVIGFIHARSEALSMALINGTPKPLVLLDINSYKWKKKNARASARFGRMKHHQKKVEKGTVIVKARDLAKDGNWETIQ